MNRHSHAVGMRRMRRCVYATISDMTLPHDRLDDVEWLRARRAEGRAVKALAAELHVDHRRVSAALRRAGLPVPLPVVHVPRLHDRDWLAATLREHSMAEVAWALKCSRTSVRYAVRKFGLSAIDGHKPPPAVDATLADRQWLTRRRAEGATVRKLAAELGTSADRVGAAVRAAGLPPLRRNGSHPAFPELYDVEWVGATGRQIVRTDSMLWRDGPPDRLGRSVVARRPASSISVSPRPGETEHPRSLFGHRLAAIRPPRESTGSRSGCSTIGGADNGSHVPSSPPPSSGSRRHRLQLLRCGTPDELAGRPNRRLRVTIGLRHHDDGRTVSHAQHSSIQS